MKIMFWSLYHGQCGVSSSLLTYAAMTALYLEKKTLILHNQLSHSMIERYCGLSDESTLAGIDSVMALLKNKNLELDEICHYSHSLLKSQKLDLLGGSGHDHNTAHKDIHKIFNSVVNLADFEYDSVFVDARAGLQEGTESLIQTCDLVIICVNQNERLLEDVTDFLSKRSKDKDKFKVLVSLYDQQAKMTRSNMTRRYGFKNLFVLPYSPLIKDALNGSVLVETINRHLQAKKRDKLYEFIKAAKELVDEIGTY